MFTELYMLRALAAAALLAPTCALLGVFVTARRMSFFSDTIAHGALAGVALGVWFGMTDLTVPMILFSLLVAAAILWIKENTELMTDTIMALLLSGSVALGIIILRLLGGSLARIHGYLFGDILGLGNQDVVFAAILFAVVFVGVFWKLSQLTLLSAHEEMAHVCGISVKALNYLFILGLTITVAMSIRLLGIILVTALLVVPPAAARNISLNLRQQMIYSLMLGLTAGVVGIMGSFQFDVPCGPAIVLVSIGLFILTLAVGKFLNRASKHE
ncbi:MAG: metal ABC transporter permease, partial [Limisphaerales bacterium]